jgi:hypothetical protein
MSMSLENVATSCAATVFGRCSAVKAQITHYERAPCLRRSASATDACGGFAPTPPGFSALVPLPIGGLCAQIAEGGCRSIPLNRSRPLSRRAVVRHHRQATICPQLPLAAKPVWGLHQGQQQCRPKRADGGNLAQYFHGLMFLTFGQQLSTHGVPQNQ